MKNKSTQERAIEIIKPIAEELGYYLVEVQYKKEHTGMVLAVCIDKPGGVNINDCEVVNRALSAKMDELDFIEDAYILEVSSPGLGRTLKKDKHLEKSIGEEVEIKLYKPVEKRKEFSGILERFDKDSITITEDGVELTFERTAVALIRLALDF